jgi:hypothetical protein
MSNSCCGCLPAGAIGGAWAVKPTPGIARRILRLVLHFGPWHDVRPVVGIGGQHAVVADQVESGWRLQEDLMGAV